jgi:hypothetical protein
MALFCDAKVTGWCRLMNTQIYGQFLIGMRGAGHLRQTDKHATTALFYKLVKWTSILLWMVIVAPHAMAKSKVDFDPNLDFSKFKTFAYIGGTQMLEFRPLNPDRIKNDVHTEVAKALVAKGLVEVQPDQQPDLVVRYSANSQSKIVTGGLGAWDQLGGFEAYYWAYTFDMMQAESSLDGMLVIDLIDLKHKDLAWRLYIVDKIVDEDSIWGKVLAEIPKGFNSYPPSPKQIEEKKKERAEHPPKPPATQ